ncbi:hypothetical protein P3G55_11170 [Leptospira sp. 96542]|nr:hypothetical protein [Leptospira sp. 96542]
MKFITVIVFFFGLFVGCTKKKSSDDDLLLLTTLYLLQPTDIVLELGYPGSVNQIQHSDLEGKTAGATVKVGGVAATGVSQVSSNSLQFTMPTVSGITENSSVDFVVEQNGAVVFSNKVRYRPLVEWQVNQPHSVLRPIDGRDNKSFFQITATTAMHVFNTFGHGFSDLDIYYFTGLNASPVAFAEKRMNGAEFNRVSLNAGTVYVMVKHVGGGGGTFNLQVANSGVVPSSSAILLQYDEPSLCYDTMGTGPATGNTCAVLQANNIANAGWARTGRCTYPSDGGLTTRNYYFKSGIPSFSTPNAENTCLNPGNGSSNEAESIFIAN